MYHGGFSLVLLTLATTVAAEFSSVYLNDEYCPLDVCSCNVQGAVIDCDGQEYISVESLMTVDALGTEQTHTFFRNLRSIIFEPKAVRVLPDFDNFNDYFPEVKYVFLGAARMANCTELEVYRDRGVTVQSDICADEKAPAVSGVGSSMEFSVSKASSSMDEKPLASSINESTKKSEADMAWTVIFLNCCFVGLSGMILGALLAVVLPPLFNKLVKRIRHQKNQQVVMDLGSQAKFHPLLQSHTENYSATSMPRCPPGSAKRASHLEV